MKKWTAVLVAAFASFSGGCGAMFPDQRLREAETTGLLHLGLTQAEVAQVLGRQPNRVEDRIFYSRTEKGTRTVWYPGAGGTNLASTYRLVFDDGILVEIGHN